jgi:hypothetical protein
MNTANSAEANVNSWTDAISRANSAKGNTQLQSIIWVMFVTIWGYMILRNGFVVNYVQWQRNVERSVYRD